MGHFLVEVNLTIIICKLLLLKIKSLQFLFLKPLFTALRTLRFSSLASTTELKTAIYRPQRLDFGVNAWLPFFLAFWSLWTKCRNVHDPGKMSEISSRRHGLNKLLHIYIVK